MVLPNKCLWTHKGTTNPGGKSDFLVIDLLLCTHNLSTVSKIVTFPINFMLLDVNYGCKTVKYIFKQFQTT